MEEFLIPGAIWFIAPSGSYAGVSELAGEVHCGFFDDRESGQVFPIIYAFTDEDLAEEYLRRHQPQTFYFTSRSMPDDHQLIQLLTELQNRGHRIIGFDAESPSVQLLPISKTIEQIRARAPD